ncbi:hypothetical protein [Rummeliibacillus stabekisii]|uniref:Uncharacterized protein n=1 Tax=Rummeliibacillus stabekisii TaxID=241244 RepID=A0A143HCT1_9BACL|nr:hypothetical protein [Rummeliibacillus stabekisii]AMW99239.1 hypothetical protein ATY39_07025 [Rummeliibacillus stabekisii]
MERNKKSPQTVAAESEEVKLNEISLLASVSKIITTTNVVIEELEKNNFTYEETVALLVGMLNPFIEVLEKNPEKRTTIVKRV